MNDCYKFQLRKYGVGFFDSCVDMTYIITMVGSEQINHIEKQLEKYIPTKNIYIVYNKGYKNCNKKLRLYIPPYDITHTYFTIIEHSIKNNYNNILILEDDFIFNSNIKNPRILNELCDFFKNSPNIPFFYNLGAFPLLFYPNFTFNNTYEGYFILTAHAIIYNKKIQLDLIKYKNDDIKHWDFFITEKYKSYFYKYPLCYQTFRESSNQQYWLCNTKNSIVCSFLNYMVNKFFKNMYLHEKPEPGFYIMYSIFFVIHYILIFLVICLLWVICYYIAGKLGSLANPPINKI
jgi:hypothetical protein